MLLLRFKRKRHCLCYIELQKKKKQKVLKLYYKKILKMQKNMIAEKSQLKTQRGESKRPYGVGLLIAGFDRTGPRLFRTCPSANLYEYYCVAIGSRSQAATSFLENNMEKLPKMSKDDLVKIALEATRKAEDVKINGNNLDVIVVGKDETTKLLSIQEIDDYLKSIDNKMDLS